MNINTEHWPILALAVVCVLIGYWAGWKDSRDALKARLTEIIEKLGHGYGDK